MYDSTHIPETVAICCNGLQACRKNMANGWRGREINAKV